MIHVSGLSGVGLTLELETTGSINYLLKFQTSLSLLAYFSPLKSRIVYLLKNDMEMSALEVILDNL